MESESTRIITKITIEKTGKFRKVEFIYAVKSYAFFFITFESTHPLGVKVIEDVGTYQVE